MKGGDKRNTRLAERNVPLDGGGTLTVEIWDADSLRMLGRTRRFVEEIIALIEQYEDDTGQGDE